MANKINIKLILNLAACGFHGTALLPEMLLPQISVNYYILNINLADKSLLPHLPYIVFYHLDLLFVPSTNPPDNGDEAAFSIASTSFSKYSQTVITFLLAMPFMSQ